MNKTIYRYEIMGHNFTKLIFLAYVATGCAPEITPVQKPKSNSGGVYPSDNATQQQQQTQMGQNFGNGRNVSTPTESWSDKGVVYPAFLLRGKGTMQHVKGTVEVHRKLTYRISDETQHTTLDIMTAVSGDYASHVNESLLGSGEATNVELISKRSSSSELSGSGEVTHQAYIYINEIKKENTFKNTAKTWRASKPLPLNVRPGASSIYKSLQESGGTTYTTQISGEKSFTLVTHIEVVSLTENEAVLKMKNSVPSDSSGASLNGFPLPEEQTVTVDTQKKEIVKYQTKSFYLDDGRKFYSNIHYEICAFKKGGELTVYSLCNY